MRIAFVGKGGSGKTTFAALATRIAAHAGIPVLAIDADINQHLGPALGFPPPPPLGAAMERIASYVRGANPRIQPGQLAKTTPPGTGSRFIRLGTSDPLLGEFAHSADGIQFLATGPLTDADVGLRCFHSKVMPMEVVLNHLLDRPGELVLVDMTAGADAFASGLFTRFDLLVVVCEPTERSVAVLEQFQSPCDQHGISLVVLGNKVEDAHDAHFLKERVGTRLVASAPRSAFVRALDRGERPDIAELEQPVRDAVAAVLDAARAHPRDWARLQRQAEAFHARNAEDWMNARYGTDVRTQIDPAFDLAAEAART